MAYLAAATLSEKFARLTDIGIALASRVLLPGLIGAGRWVEAGAIMKNVTEDFPFIDRVFLADPGGILMLEEDYAGKLDDEGRRLLGVIRDSSQKMGDLIDDLLAFSRLGRRPIAAAEVNMNALVREVVNELQAVPGDIAQQCAIGRLPAAWCDRALLRQVWVNLLSNAFKFAGGREQPVVRVLGHDSITENVYSVSDNGVGFEMQYYDKLFGVFQRLHGSDEFPGTGVGLAIVQRVVSRHGGRVWAEGKVNAGATFYFALPKG